ncbi:armadillo-type protein [Cyathus striatus]|nr:armadillo-type protein [Cyathus striatus]
MTKGYLMNSLIEKMQSPDQDFRFMGLNDLMNEIKTDPNSFVGDESVENKVLKQVLSLVEDKISEVKNQAVKCLGQLIKILRPTQMELVVDKLIDFSGGKDEELRDISGLALKTITAELPPDGKVAGLACAKLAPKLLNQIQSPDTPSEALVETLSILSILISRFPNNLSSGLNPPPLAVLPPLLSHQRPVVRKRAILTLSQFIPISSPELFSQLLRDDVFPNLSPSASIDRQRTTIQLVAAIARHSPLQIAPVLDQIIPGILQAKEKDDEELRESCLQALEALVLRCPAEITQYLSSIIIAGNQFIKYDPNYAGDDEDEEMADADEDDDDDDDELDEYSDDEDTSYKIRRSATKLLAAIIATRPELLVSVYKDVSPVLVSRFSDREETVRLEVWATYGILLNQTGVYGGIPQNSGDSSPRGKRKRDTEETMDLEESPYTLLKSQVPSLSKVLLSQLKSSKTSSATLQAGFSLLHSLLGVLPGSLTTQVSAIVTTCKTILSQSPSTSTSTLHLTTLSFLGLFFATHDPSTFSSSLPVLTPVLLKSIAERHPRIASETFRVFSALLNSTKPVNSEAWAEAVYNQALSRLAAHDTDSEVRSCAEDCIADLWICATDIVKRHDRKEWEYICRTSGKTEGAVKVVTKVATEVPVDDQWVNGCVDWTLGLLKKSGRLGKAEVFGALNVLLKSYASGIPADLSAIIIPQVKTYLTTSDISLLSHALSTLALLLELSPITTFPEVERDLLGEIYNIAHSPLVAGSALEALFRFFSALVQADNQIATHVVPNLVISAEKAPKAESSPSNVAKCIAQVVQSQQAVAAGTIAEYSKNIKRTSKAKPSLVTLSLMIVGELGRFIDMSPQVDIFNNVIDHFAADQEEIRSAAAFAAGNIAVGNLHQFLPVILKMVENEPSKRLLALHAAKEVVTHCPQGQLEGVADLLWAPLFENSQNAEETTRNVAAACLGKLATTHPSKYLPQLHDRIKDQSAATRATVVSAIRYTFADTTQSYDELLPLSSDLTVRRLALSSLNSAARTKPHLVRDHLSSLIPSLYAETVVKPELIRTVQMGPWTHKVDEGLEARKTAYETMYTLLDTCLTKLDLHEFLGRVLPGLSDDSDEIKVISHMMLFRLSQVAPASVSQRLDEATPQLEKTMKGATVTKDTVKQDLERAAELQRSALRAVAALSKVAAPGLNPKFDIFVEEVKRNATWGNEFKELVG